MDVTRDIHVFSDTLGEESLPVTGPAQQDDVGLLDRSVLVMGTADGPFHVVVHGYGKSSLRLILTDNASV